MTNDPDTASTYGGAARSYYRAPFAVAGLDALDWFLLTGLLLICFVAWRFILIHITEVVSE